MLKKFAYKAVATGLLISLSGAASAALSDQWYIGIGGGISQLQPEATNSAIDVDDKNGQVGTIFFGRDFDSRSSGQFQLYSLGESSFDDGQSTASYVAGDASLLYRFYDSRDRRSRGAVFGTSFYGRFGFGFLDRDSDLPLDDDTPVYFGAGAGLETYFSNNIGLRLEALYHETDTASATLTLVTRFGGHRRRPAITPPAVATPKPETVTSPVTTPAAVPLAPEESVPAFGPESDSVSATEPASSPLSEQDSATAIVPDQGTGSSESPLELPTLDTTGSELPALATPGSELPTLDTVEPAPDGPLQSADNSFPEVEIMGSTQENTSSTDQSVSGDAAVPVQPVPGPSVQPVPGFDSSSTVGDGDGDGVNDARDRCPDSNSDYPVSTRGCPLFAGLLPDLTFRDGTAEFDVSSYAVLDKLVQTLKDYPGAYIEIVAHTDNRGTELEQSALTRQRLRSVGLYLVNNGIAQDRLLLRSYGGKRPAFDNATADGRRRNNRIEVFENP